MALGDVEGIEILGGADFGSSSTCFVVLISPCGIGCVGNCTSGIDAGDDGESDTLETTCGLVRVDAGKGWRIVLTTAAAEDEAWFNICVAADVACCGLSMVTPAGIGVN